MTRLRTVLGLIAGAIMVLSSAAHSFLGWKSLQAKLLAAQAPSDLIQGLAIGWHFAGAAMLAFGIIVIAIFAKRLRGEAVSSLPAMIIAVLLVISGIWAMTITRNPFFFIFIVPGLMLAAAAWPEKHGSV
jgi:hypothetical protein